MVLVPKRGSAGGGCREGRVGKVDVYMEEGGKRGGGAMGAQPPPGKVKALIFRGVSAPNGG